MLQGIIGLQFSQEEGTWYVQSGCASIDSLPQVVLYLGTLPVPLTPRQ